jgi:uncharacterized protein YuzE
METIYFEDVDTLKVVLRDELAPVVETVDGPKEHTMMDFDEEGRLVGLTIGGRESEDPARNVAKERLLRAGRRKYSSRRCRQRPLACGQRPPSNL